MLLFADRRGWRSSGCTSRSAHMERAASRRAARRSCPSCPRCRRSTSRSTSARSGRASHRGLAAGGQGRSGRRHGRAIARRNLWISIPALLLSFAVWMVWSVVVAKLPGDRLHLHDRPAVLAGRAAGPVGRDAAHLLLLHGADLRRPAVDDALHLVADDPGDRHRLCGAEPGHALLASSWRWRCCAASAAATSPRRWPTSRFFFPKAEKGNALALNAGLGNLGVSVVQFVVPLVITAGVFGWLGGDPQTATAGGVNDHAVAAERRLRLGAVHRRRRPSRPGSA